MYKFCAADEKETIVYGAAKPGYLNEEVDKWVQFMQEQDMQRVCCLLADAQLTRYPENLLEIYHQKFGANKVCWAPIEDFHLASEETLTQIILPFLNEAFRESEKVVVHCGGGIGRTGHVLAAWLVHSRGISNHEAIAAVKKTGRDPYEAAFAAPFYVKNPWKVVTELNVLLDKCRDKHQL
ncbi:dual specificity protein phosphatase [Rivularia sp. IAM M-261]|nr:dual specificity protein phosphatase [Rivularia sp. IAM M-261]